MVRQIEGVSYFQAFYYLNSKSQSYNLTFYDSYMILSNNLLPEKHTQVWEQARLYADEVQQTHAAHPAGAEVVPKGEPH